LLKLIKNNDLYKQIGFMQISDKDNSNITDINDIVLFYVGRVNESDPIADTFKEV